MLASLQMAAEAGHAAAQGRTDFWFVNRPRAALCPRRAPGRDTGVRRGSGPEQVVSMTRCEAHLMQRSVDTIIIKHQSTCLMTAEWNTTSIASGGKERYWTIIFFFFHDSEEEQAHVQPMNNWMDVPISSLMIAIDLWPWGHCLNWVVL